MSLVDGQVQPRNIRPGRAVPLERACVKVPAMSPHPSNEHTPAPAGPRSLPEWSRLREVRLAAAGEPEIVRLQYVGPEGQIYELDLPLPEALKLLGHLRRMELEALWR
jgi:hypothetical protein